MTRDLEAVLREALEKAEDSIDDLAWSVNVNVEHITKPIHAALALVRDNPATSGEASGDDEDEIGDRDVGFMRASRPAPSEAPNVERAGKMTDEQLREWIEEHERAPWITDKKKHPQNIYGGRLLALLKNLRGLRTRIAELEKERDSARAEGIEAGLEMAAAIREAKA